MTPANLRLLVLTDHSGHSATNSLYPLLQGLHRVAPQHRIAVASSGNIANQPFFQGKDSALLHITEIDKNFTYQADGSSLNQPHQWVAPHSFDAVWLRLPPPISQNFLSFLALFFKGKIIFNQPDGIWETGSKLFLLNFPDICPPMQACHSLEDIDAFKTRFPIVLKPLRNYGGQGLVKIDGQRAWIGKEETTYAAFRKQLSQQANNINYLGVQYLENVNQGDKRIVVVDGQIMGASLRRPAPGAWLCNVAMGGQAEAATVDETEKYILAQVNPILAQKGIMMYGIDTLLDNNGQRCLSELNTTSIGGLAQIAKQDGAELIQQAAELIWQYLYRNLPNYAL